MQPRSFMDAPPPVAGEAAASLTRNLLLAARDFAVIQDKIDCAEIAHALGMADVARALYDMVFLRTGFSPAQRGWQAAVARRTGLWGGDDVPAPAEAPRTGFAVDIAVEELTGLMARSAPALPWDGAALVGTLAETIPARPAPREAQPLAVVGDACARLRRLLQRPAEDASDAALADLLAGLRRDIAETPGFALDGHLDDPSQVAAAFVAADLRDFLLANHALAFAPFGSAAIFHASARLETAGLGPYCRNVQRVARGTRDIFGLIQLAVGDAPDADRFDRWTVLLAGHLDGGALLDLIDELGDIGLMRPLWGLLLVVVRQSGQSRDRGPLWRLRDAGLDNGEMQLAACAQRVIALWAVDDLTEWRILGEIHATAGETLEAEAAFLSGLNIAPGDAMIAECLAWLRADMTAPFAINAGFATPKHRQRARFLRQGRPPLPA